MKTGYKVCDAMTEKPIALTPDDSIQQCAKVMKEQHVGAILIKKGTKLVGLVTEQDIVRKAIAEGKSPKSVTLQEVMEKNLVTISPEKDIFEALITMRDMNIRHLPVMDKGNMLGLLTLKDVLKIEPQLFDLLVEKFELREERRKPIHSLSPNEGFCQVCGEYTDALSENDSVWMCGTCQRSSD